MCFANVPAAKLLNSVVDDEESFDTDLVTFFVAPVSAIIDKDACPSVTLRTTPFVSVTIKGVWFTMLQALLYRTPFQLLPL